MDPRKVMTYDIELRKNNIETHDSYFDPFNSPSIEHVFFDIGDNKFKISPKTGSWPDTVMSVNYWLYDMETTHIREVYNVLDLVGDLGGIQGFFVMLFGVFVYPIS
jgi:hypothetical protein